MRAKLCNPLSYRITGARICVNRFPFSLKAFSQSSSGHTNGLSPVCKRMWIFKRPALEYLLLHPGTSQTNGFSPVWVNSWAWRWPLVINFKKHSLQTKGLSPVCVLICVFRLPVSVNSLRHFWNGQSKIFFWSLGLLIFSNWVVKWPSWKRKRLNSDKWYTYINYDA